MLCLLQSEIQCGLCTMLDNCAIEVYVVVTGIHCGVVLQIWENDSTASCASTCLYINCKLRCLWSLWRGLALIVAGLLSRGRKGVYIWYCSCKKLHVLTSWLLVSSSETTPSSSAVDPIVRLQRELNNVDKIESLCLITFRKTYYGE